MRIYQVTAGVSNPSAGTTYAVARLSDELHGLGHEASVLTLGPPPASWPHTAPLRIYDGRLERKTGISLTMARDLRAISGQASILHGNGVWRMANLFPLFFGRNSQARLIFSPHGMLSPWSMNYKAYIKRPFWHLLQKPALNRCHCLHVTAPLELEDIRRLGFRTPAAIIPNGVDIPPLQENVPRQKTLVFLSRIDPKKGLDLLLPAWTSIAAEFADWNLVIAGPLSGTYPESVQNLARTLNAPRVSFAGEILGEDKRALLSGSSVFVLPTYSENFGIAVAEALAHGTPVITTTETPWTEVGERRCGWCIPPNKGALRETLRDAMSRPLPELHEMGMNGREWMERSYSWRHVAEMMGQTYEWMLNGGACPACIDI